MAFDLDGDGRREVVYGYSYYRSSRVCVRGSDGALRDGWPVTLEEERIHSSPTIGDVDGDGSPEIGILAHDRDGNYSAYLFDTDGSLVAGWPKLFDGESAGFKSEVTGSSLVFVDLDLDGKLDILFAHPDARTGHLNRLFAFDHRGDAILGWPNRTAMRLYTPPAVGDLDADGSLEVVVESEDGWLAVYSHHGMLERYWRFSMGVSDRFGPILFDADGDGDLEILTSGSGEMLYLWEHTGDAHPGWPVELYESISFRAYATTVGDIDDDHSPDIVISSFDYEWVEDIYLAHLFAFRADGTPLPDWPRKYTSDETGDLYYPGILADVTGSGKSNLIIGPWSNLHNRALYVFDESGDFVDDPNTPFRRNGIYYSSPAVSDLDGDGDLEVIFIENGDRGRALVWDLDAPSTPRALQWPMLGHDVRQSYRKRQAPGARSPRARGKARPKNASTRKR